MRGFSILEILIAVAIMVSTFSAIALVSFGDQKLLGQTSADAEAVQKAHKMIKTAEANARKDFRLVNDQSTTSDEIYQDSLSVADMPTDPYTTKHITATVSWDDESHTRRNVSLSELVTDFDDPQTLDTCDSSRSGNWTDPSSVSYLVSPGSMLPTNARMAAVNTIGAVDAYHGKLYVVDSSKSAKTNDSLFIFDLSNARSPTYRGSIDTATSTVDGMNAIVVAGNYAYVANAHGANFKTCKPSGNCSQFQIFNISDPTSPVLVDNFLLPTSTLPFVYGSNGQGIGTALFYADGYIYLGLSKTANGPEFNIIDVHDPTHPHWIGGFTIGATINQIYERNGSVYLATDDQSRKLIILDARSPQSPQLVSSLDPRGTSNQEYGDSLYMAGDEMFFGMSSTSISGSPELVAFDMTNPSVPASIASREVGASILGIFVRDTELFLLTSITGMKAEFQMFDDSDLTRHDPEAAPIILPGTGVTVDCEGNYFYVATNNGSQGNISVIGPGT